MNKFKVGVKAYLNFPVEVKGVNKEENILEAIFSTQDVDRHGDTVMQDGWDLKNFLKNPVILNSHNYGDASEVIGRAEDVRVEGKKLQGKIKFAVDENPKAKVIFDLYAGGFLSAFSVGFIPTKFKENKDGSPDWFVIEEAELLEVSAVSVPANARALAKEKGIDIEKLEKPEGWEKNIRKKMAGDGIICMYCDSDITETEKQYQLETEDPQIVELVCEKCFNEKTKKKKLVDGDECEMPDGTPGEMHPNDDGEMVCMPKKDKGIARQTIDEDEPEDDEEDETDEETAGMKSPADRVKDAIHRIESKENMKLRKVADIINSILDGDETGAKIDSETKEKTRKRKLNQAIRGLFELKK